MPIGVSVNFDQRYATLAAAADALKVLAAEAS